ncbi:MAG: 4Fe-4S binding protein [candidate division WOR-3 bacterium]|nr:4Fe-4S binding protein [candidate division WOR-3 bacterium]
MNYKKTGVLTETDLKKAHLLPSKERFEKGPVAVIECVEMIPCNPCVYACPRKAISIPQTITNLPQIDFELCNGCGACIARCPGLAIFVVHKNYNNKEAAISFPYEFLPRPKVGEIVDATDRKGQIVCKARVEKVIDSKANDRCAVVTIAVPKRYYNKVRFIKLKHLK